MTVETAKWSSVSSQDEAAQRAHHGRVLGSVDHEQVLAIQRQTLIAQLHLPIRQDATHPAANRNVEPPRAPFPAGAAPPLPRHSAPGSSPRLDPRSHGSQFPPPRWHFGSGSLKAAAIAPWLGRTAQSRRRIRRPCASHLITPPFMAVGSFQIPVWQAEFYRNRRHRPTNLQLRTEHP